MKKYIKIWFLSNFQVKSNVNDLENKKCHNSVNVCLIVMIFSLFFLSSQVLHKYSLKTGFKWLCDIFLSSRSCEGHLKVKQNYRKKILISIWSHPCIMYGAISKCKSNSMAMSYISHYAKEMLQNAQQRTWEQYHIRAIFWC